MPSVTVLQKLEQIWGHFQDLLWQFKSHHQKHRTSEWCDMITYLFQIHINYQGADKSLAQPGRKQATATEDFDFHMSYL